MRSNSPSARELGPLDLKLTSSSHKSKHPIKTMASLVRSESFNSNPESPASPSKNQSETTIAEQDLDFDSKTYANELLEHGLKEERFRIDRKKLEDMLQIHQNSNNAAENAEVFFQRVMMETSTLVTWPSKLKIGAKSKKDPHVKIVGKPEAVQQAKEKILEILDTKKNRVTLKMDVSHSDHSYIIGKGGFKIQQVMEETGCHIHFPDSNKPKPRVAFPCFKPSIADLRNNLTTEKSNQVSIAGQAAGVELARAKIRDLLPFVYMFELPNGETVNPGEECSPAIQHIQQTYSFNVAFRLTTIGRTVVIVRGCQRLLSRLRQGLSLLMEYLTGSKTVPVMGFMKTEIAAQHHHFVMGNCNVNIQMIMNKTGATVTFPDSSTFSPDSPTQTIPVLAGHSVMRSKSTVIIQGSFDSVCMAWQEIIKCLPLVLMFDLKEGQELDPVMVNNFVETFNINITVRPKIKENTKSVLISGTEKDCKVLFKVRKEILGLDEDDSSSSPTRPRTFQVPCNGKISEGKNSISNVAQNLSTAESINLLSAIIQQNPQIVGLLSNLSSAIPTMNPPDVLPHVSLPNPVYRTAVQNQVNQISMDQYAAKRDVENWINHHGRGYTLQDGSSTKRNLGDDDVDSADSGIYVHRRNRFQHVLEAKNEVSSQPESSASSTSSNDTPDYKVNAFFKRMSQSNEPTLGTEVHHLLADYGNKKLSANKAMQQQIGDGVRTPTQLWSGYGFSKSMPDYAARMKKATRNSGSITEYLDMDNSKSSATWSSDLVDKNDSPTEAISPFSFSNFWENIPKQPTIDYGTIKTVEQLLNLLDLQKYSEVLSHHEIDLITLLTLTDIDLQQLGISYGARRKMLAAIAAIRDHRLGDCLKNFRAAPGAERKTFLTRYPPGSPISDDNGARM